MKYVKDEKGSATIYLLWIMTTIIVISVIVINIARVYVVKHQASTAAHLGAIAATSEILFATEEAIKEFDEKMLELLEVDADYEPLWDEILERKSEHMSMGDAEEEAYIKSLNEILPSSLSNELLKEIFEMKFKMDPTLSSDIYHSVEKIVRENEGNEEHLEIVISEDKYRVEVKTDATFDSITDGSFLNRFSKDIPQKGYGPSLRYLQYVLN
ncbi:pilus assembly protein TadG-related protein [Lysinibacillus antri]|uniref:Putative Flp pilus-assembly TadG-like N-terminal domain-containing protein n=1 Tax=Lysinibacillus antri TaxID=2498145 RepID=A0A432LEF6_9BACI|nr:pilus assembly protein TadG-related protein [Lysinibacillus antri]RUL54227.1 hypothetical protein EK386_06865 [Lysinibacillus antri]